MPKWLDPVGWWNWGWAWLCEERPYERDLALAAESPSQTGCRYADGRVAQIGDVVVVAKPAGRYSVAGVVMQLFPDDAKPAGRYSVAGVVMQLFPDDGQIEVYYLHLAPFRSLVGSNVRVVELRPDNWIGGRRLVGLVIRYGSFLAKDFRKIE